MKCSFGFLDPTTNAHTDYRGSMSSLGNCFSYGAAPWCRRPSSLGCDALPKSGTSASPAGACGLACLWETLAKHRVARFRRVAGMVQQGLVCIIETSFQKASQPMKHCIVRRDISKAHFRAFWRQALPGMPAMLGPCCTKRRMSMLICRGWTCVEDYALERLQIIISSPTLYSQVMVYEG